MQDTDEISSNLVSYDADQDTGATSLHTAIELNSGDKIKFQVYGDADLSCSLMTPGTILRIIQV